MLRIIGIDLGTTNSALAVAESESSTVRSLEIEQIDSPGNVSKSHTLPSFYYIPHESDGDPSRFTLPDHEYPFVGVAGKYAKERGSQVPDRLISSAKSWLCHTHVNRTEKFLPWKSDTVQPLLSPVEISSHFLAHLKHAAMSQLGGESSTNRSWVVTVPASFDEIARQLTVQAADQAGIKEITLLEEPLAAFYSWIAANPNYHQEIEPGDQILVCDVGGGTTDFTLIAVGESDGKIELTRVSVGDHLLLGGDNMDLALAVKARYELESAGKKLDHWQFISLISQVRDAKERLLSDDGSVDELQVSVVSRGASLFASSLSVTIRRSDVEALIVNGFFPEVGMNDPLTPGRSAGLHEVGLHYESEPAITRHLVRFLRNSVAAAQAAGSARSVPSVASGVSVRPTAVLFNGGVFKSKVLRERMTSVLRSCTGNAQLKVLQASDLELAVSKGAAYYGYLKHSGKGVRVRAGVARSFYIGIDSNMPAVPGYTPPVMGLCLVPQGTEEGTDIELAEKKFSLVVGQPVKFRFFSTNTRVSDKAGQMVEDAERELQESEPLHSQMAAEGRRSGDFVTVTMNAKITETGTLVISLRDIASDASWNLEFNVRANEQ